MLKRSVRYALHVFILYLVVRFSTGVLVDFMYEKLLPAIQRHPMNGNATQFFFSHLLAFSLIPALMAGLIINAKFRHGVARHVWIVPLAILTLVFLFRGPGVYPTMLWESDFRKAFHYYFGGVFNLLDYPAMLKDSSRWADLFRAYSQLRYTVPAYAGAAYSLGAALGMSVKSRKLQAVVERF